MRKQQDIYWNPIQKEETWYDRHRWDWWMQPLTTIVSLVWLGLTFSVFMLSSFGFLFAEYWISDRLHEIIYGSQPAQWAYHCYGSKWDIIVPMVLGGFCAYVASHYLFALLKRIFRRSYNY
jgi:hypothetical protein